MTSLKDNQAILEQSVDDNQVLYIQTSHRIHEKPEIGNEEFFASDLHCKNLTNAGFTVERGVAGHETAFRAIKDSGKEGPTIAYLAEYDALPGLGHACGHNIIGTSSVAAAIALAEVIDETGGRVVVFGTPAEEGGPNGSAKGSFADQGFLADVDAALMLHPGGRTELTPESLAVDPLEFRFYGKPAHASAVPHLGVNALDGVIQLFNGVNALRQQVTSDVRIHGIITHGGDAPNIIPEFAAARFYIRAATWKKTEETAERVRAVAKGAAQATGTKVIIERFQNVVKDLVPTPALDVILSEELTAVGEKVITDKRENIGSTDAGNISHEVPTAHGYIKIGPAELPAHTVEFREAAKSEQGDQALITGAKALARTGYRLLIDEKLLDKVKADHKRALEEKKVL